MTAVPVGRAPARKLGNIGAAKKLGELDVLALPVPPVPPVPPALPVVPVPPVPPVPPLLGGDGGGKPDALV